MYAAKSANSNINSTTERFQAVAVVIAVVKTKCNGPRHTHAANSLPARLSCSCGRMSTADR